MKKETFLEKEQNDSTILNNSFFENLELETDHGSFYGSDSNFCESKSNYSSSGESEYMHLPARMRKEYKFRDNYIQKYNPDPKSQKDFEMLGTAQIIPFTNKKLRLKPGGPKDMFGEEIEGPCFQKIN